MSIELTALVNDRSLGLRLVTGSPHRAVGWAHSSDLADPSPFLEADNLLLTTGTQFADDAPEAAYRAYVDRLVDVGVAAIGFGTEVVRSGTPHQLVDACTAAGLPLVEVPFRTPFIAITRRIADARAAQEHARDLWTLEAQRALSLAALARDRLAAVLDELARRLSASVILFDAYGETTSAHGPRILGAEDREAIATEARRLLHRHLRSSSALELGGIVASLQTLGRRDELRGVLAVGLEHRPDTAATAVITSAVALAEFSVEDAARQQEATLTLNAELLQLALAGQVVSARRVLAVAGGRLPESSVRVVLSRLGPGTEPGELEHALSVRAAARGGAVLGARWRDAFVAVVEEPLARDAAELVAGRQPPVVLSRSVDWSGVGSALREGLAELDRTGQYRAGQNRAGQNRAGQNRAGHGNAAAVIELGSGALLGLLSQPDVAAAAERRLAPLRAAPDAADLRRAVEAWLAHNAAWEPAARELGLHRHTLKGLVRRVGTLLGLDLDTFEAKAELWALLRAG
ncbi:MAG TPA: PucR family transcriptional regulator [Microlunatus sp.]|nr:PucR family transcriptional regulator [Microlunatus sp.]